MDRVPQRTGPDRIGLRVAMKLEPNILERVLFLAEVDKTVGNSITITGYYLGSGKGRTGCSVPLNSVVKVGSISPIK